MTTQPPLFDLPDTPPPRKRAAPTKARYARYKPRTRTLCDDCVALIHRLGQGVAPFPRSVRWRRSSPEGVLHLCQIHRDERLEMDQ